MRKLLILAAMFCPAVFGYASFSGFCEQGGVKVTVQGINSTSTFMQSYPNLAQSAAGPHVTVYVAGTTTKAVIYSDNAGTILANPFPCTATGEYGFWSPLNIADLLFSGTGISSFTVSSSPGGTLVSYVTNYGAAGNGTQNDTSSIQSCMTAALACVFPEGLSYKTTSTLQLGNRGSIAGTRPFSSAIIAYAGNGGSVIGNTAGAAELSVSNLSIAAPAAANAISFNGESQNTTNTEISGINFNPSSTSAYSNSCVKLVDTFLVHLFNNRCTPVSANYGFDFAGNNVGLFNDTNAADGNRIEATSLAGIHCSGSCTGMKLSNNVIESNGRKGIWIESGNPQGQLEIINNHFENNSLGTADYDMYIAPQGATPVTFNGNTGSVKVSLNESNNPSGLGFLYLSSMRSAEVTDNICDPGSAKTIKLGPAVINAYVARNRGCTLVGDSGLPINDSQSTLTFSNLFAWSTDMTNAAWTVLGSGASIDRSGNPLFTDGNPAFNLNLGSASSVTPASVTGSYTTTATGRYFATGIWAKTTTGTAIAYASINDSYAVYTGTLIPTQQAITIGPNWTYVTVSSTTSGQSVSAYISASFNFYSLSGATTIVIADPWLCGDSMNCGFVPTTSAAIVNAAGPSIITPTAFASQNYGFGTAIKDAIVLWPNISAGTVTDPSSWGGYSWGTGNGCPNSPCTILGRFQLVLDDPFVNNSSHLEFWTTNGVTLTHQIDFDSSGNIRMRHMATSCSGQPTGVLWNDTGTVKYCP